LQSHKLRHILSLGSPSRQRWSRDHLSVDLSAPDGSVLTTHVVLYPPYASDVDYPPLKTPFNQLNIVHFDLILCFDVFIAFHRKTTFHTGTNFFNHFFIATKSFKLALEYHHVITEYANRFVTMQYAFKNQDRKSTRLNSSHAKSS